MEIIAEQVRSLFESEDHTDVLERLRVGETRGSVEEALAEGLARVRKEREPACFTTAETWRFATRQAAGRSRLGFLREHVAKGSTIVDASCGIGLMLRELAELEPARLVGIEIDLAVAELARANLALFGIEAEILVADATAPETRALLETADLVFCDPARVDAAEERILEESVPSYRYLATSAKRLAYEVSPRVEIETLPRDVVIELYSERRRHARTTVYGGFDTEPRRRVVSDRAEMVEGQPAPFVSAPIGTGGELELLDPTIVHAGLAHLFGAWHEASGKHLRLVAAVSGEQFIEEFGVIARGTFVRIRDAAFGLDDFGRIALRYSVPSEEYWERANAVRPSGHGTRTIHVFKVEDEYLLCEPIP